MANLEEIKRQVKENLARYGYDGEIADKIVSVVRPGVVLVEINGEKNGNVFIIFSACPVSSPVTVSRCKRFS